MDGGTQPAAQEERRLAFSFSGNSWDYFKICLRTYLLAILTLGIYDAWGSVERRRYLLGHTKLDGHGFDYHAKPWVILLARLIVLAFIVDIAIFSQIWPAPTAISAVAVLVLLTPWIINSAYRFQLRNTSYRTLRFDFRGSYFQALWRYVLIGPLVMIPTLGLAYPWVVKLRATYAGDHMRYGEAPFSMNIRIMPVFWILLISYAVFIALFVVAILVVGITAAAMSVDWDAAPQDVMVQLDFTEAGFNILFLIIVTTLSGVIRGAVRKAVLLGASLEGGHRFESTLRPWRYGVFVMVSWLATVVTGGLAGPWATVRIRRYELDSTAMLSNGDLDGFTGKERDAGEAVGAEIGVLEGLAGAGF